MPAPGGAGTYNPGAPPPGGFYSLGGGDKTFGNIDPSSGYYYTKQYSGKPGESIAEAMGSLTVRPELLDQKWSGAQASGMRWGYDPAINAKRWGYDYDPTGKGSHQITPDTDYTMAGKPGQVQGYDYGKNQYTWTDPNAPTYGGPSKFTGAAGATGYTPKKQPGALGQMQPKAPKGPKAPGVASLAPTGGGTQFAPSGPQGAGGPEGVFSNMFNKKVFPGSQG